MLKPEHNKIYDYCKSGIEPIEPDLYQIYIQDKNDENHYLVKVFRKKKYY